MKILHCADIHLDSTERREELVMAFHNMISDGVKEKVTAVIIAGDLFDKAGVSAFSRKAVLDEIKAHTDISFYYLRGNHDNSNVFGKEKNLPENLFMFNDEWTVYDLGENVMLTGAELTAENAGMLYSSLKLDQNAYNIVVLHGQEYASSAKDRAGAVSLKDLKDQGIDYLALGHIHFYKCEMLDTRGRYCYPGCLEARGFDEAGEHGYIILDIDPITHETKIEKRCDPIRLVYEEEVDVTGCMSSHEIADRIEEEIDKRLLVESNLLKVILVGEVDAECEKNTDYIEKRFSSRFYEFRLKDQTRISIDFDAYAGSSSLKGEFVNLVKAAEDLSEEDKKRIIRIGILALKGEEVD